MSREGSLRDLARECAAFECGRHGADHDAYSECVAECVQRAGVSSECASCYGGAEACTLGSSCQPPCPLDTCSEACLVCLEAGRCLETLNACKGSNEDECAS